MAAKSSSNVPIKVFGAAVLCVVVFIATREFSKRASPDMLDKSGPLTPAAILRSHMANKVPKELHIWNGPIGNPEAGWITVSYEMI